MTWSIVDFGEHPELVQVALDSRLRLVECSNCARYLLSDAMLLLHLPDAFPHLIFCPADGTNTDSEAASQLQLMLDHIGADGGVNVDEPPIVGPLSLVPLLVRRTLDGRVAEDLIEWHAPEPRTPVWDAYESAIGSLRHRRLNQDLIAIMQMALESFSFVDARPLVETRPELRSPYVDEYLAQFVSGTQQQGVKEAAHYLSELRGLLRRVRDIGVDAAFDEYERDVRAGRSGPIAAGTALGVRVPDWVLRQHLGDQQ